MAISTNDSGPWGADFWWLLYGKDGELACAFPEMATGDKEAADMLIALPGFDFEAFGHAAMTQTVTVGVENITLDLASRRLY